jgi:hypothetical protein
MQIRYFTGSEKLKAKDAGEHISPGLVEKGFKKCGISNGLHAS